MICLTNTGSGFVLMEPQPTDYTTCTYILQSGNEISAWHPLSINDGAQIAVAIGACWAAGYAFRVLGQYLRSETQKQGE
jgi:hypothetical protein